MNNWVLILVLGLNVTQFDMQSEDACVIAAKRLTMHFARQAACVNTFDGTALYFEAGGVLE